MNNLSHLLTDIGIMPALVVCLALAISVRAWFVVRRVRRSLANQAGKASQTADTMRQEHRLYIGNVDYATEEQELACRFAEFGKIEAINLPVDRRSGRARGFGFVTFTKVQDAQRAIAALNGSEFKGRRIQVSFARQRNN